MVRLLVIYDKKCLPHPPESHYIYELMFFCKTIGGELKAGFDILGADFIPLEALPELALSRILKSQLEQLFARAQNENTSVYFD